MPHQFEPTIVARFGSSSAKPRAIRAYSARDGWVVLPKPQALTHEVVEDLRKEGYTMVEAKWRLQSKQVSLTSLA